MQNKTRRLTESAMLIALAVVLELAGRMIIPPMPFGGQLTLVCMLPIVIISYRTNDHCVHAQLSRMINKISRRTTKFLNIGYTILIVDAVP